ncbi:sugar phosphate isomerase/epimerase family protein [candidate division KSB1 bacterium]
MDIFKEQISRIRKTGIGRRDFFKISGIGIMCAAAAGCDQGNNNDSAKNTKQLTRAEKLKQIASNSYAVNRLFKRSTPSSRPEIVQLKEKYGEITLLDFPQFTKDMYPGVEAMDLWSSLFGDVMDDTQYLQIERGGLTRRGDFDPSTLSSKKYLDLLADKIADTGVRAVHISNNAPRNIADPADEARREGIRAAKLWLDASKQIGVKSMRVNTGGPRIIPQSEIQGGYPQNNEIVPYIKRCIDSFSEMAEYGEKVGVKVTIENHWGLAAHPMNIRIILNEVNSPYCEASPDFCNWEHEYMLYHGLEALVPYATSMIHAKRWTRYPDVDIPRCVGILKDADYRGYISLEYEAGGDPVEGTLQLMNDVVDAM